MKDTLECLSVKEPLSIGDLGSIFWSQSYSTGEGVPESWDTLEDFLKFCNQEWEQHYDVPFGGGFSLTLKLNKPLRDNGFESVRISVDYLMSTIESVFSVDGGQVSIEELSLPKELILCLKDLLLEFKGEELCCNYCCLPGEGDPTEVDIEFVSCYGLTLMPDDLLPYIATRLSRAISAN